MTNNDIVQDAYNKFSGYDNISYALIKYLMLNDELTWKLMYYDDPDCWNKPDLTYAQKAGLIYNGTPEETNYRVFLDTGADNSWTVQACILRVSPLVATPKNYVFGNITIGFECYCHYRLSHTSQYRTRVAMMVERIITVFNGADIEGVGRIYFDSRINSACKVTTIGTIPYKGQAVVMSVSSLG